jgi:hypothetical protein
MPSTAVANREKPVILRIIADRHPFDWGSKHRSVVANCAAATARTLVERFQLSQRERSSSSGELPATQGIFQRVCRSSGAWSASRSFTPMCSARESDQRVRCASRSKHAHDAGGYSRGVSAFTRDELGVRYAPTLLMDVSCSFRSFTCVRTPRKFPGVRILKCCLRSTLDYVRMLSDDT